MEDMLQSPARAPAQAENQHAAMVRIQSGRDRGRMPAATISPPQFLSGVVIGSHLAKLNELRRKAPPNPLSAASAVSCGRVSKAMVAFGAALCTALMSGTAVGFWEECECRR